VDQGFRVHQNTGYVNLLHILALTFDILHTAPRRDWAAESKGVGLQGMYVICLLLHARSSNPMCRDVEAICIGPILTIVVQKTVDSRIIGCRITGYVC
jgi:hypothetical protein